MNIVFRLLHLCFGGCHHRHTYRERRKLHGVDVLHLVCEDCGHAAPAIERTAREHKRIVKAGAVKPVKARRARTDLVTVPMRRGA
jgi:hypothetical protein